MKRLASILILGIISICSWAQVPENASNSYLKYQKLSAENAGKAELFNALTQCYIDNMAAVQSFKEDDPRHKAAKEAVISIWPGLSSAATYYDSKDKKKAVWFSRAYVDVSTSEVFRSEKFAKDGYYPTIVFYAASNSFNMRDYESAIRYFKEYLATGEQKHNYNVKKYLAVAYVNIKNYKQAKLALDEAIAMNPTDYELLAWAINVCVESEDNKLLQKYLSKALTIKPNDKHLLDIQGKLYEDRGNYLDALNIYSSLFTQNPTNLSYAKHVALNNYNLGVLFTNKASLESDSKLSSQHNKKAVLYYDAAIPIIKEILKADPGLLQYHEALAIAYQQTGRKSEFDIVNKDISNLGGRALSSGNVPSLMAYSSSKQSEDVSIVGNEKQSEEVPQYTQYAKQYVEERIEKWQAKDPYETIDEYKSRVTVKTREFKIKELLKEAENSYIKLYARDVNVSDLRLCPYDAEHEVFLAESCFGDVLIPVPRANNEARIFESSWKGVQCMNPRYAISDNRIILQGLTFVTPMGKTYRFDGKNAKDYVQTEVDMQFADINYDNLNDARYKTAISPSKKVKISVGISDVDKNIPETKAINDRTFAVIIANEDYDMVADVPMALNDGKTFSLYCEKTLGLPKNNIRLYENATYGIMRHAMSDISSIASAYGGDINVIFYYAGHGFPDESSKEAYILPVDGDGLHTDVSYSLNKLYSDLNGMSAKSVIVFLDACFSGSNRDGSMLASARGVALKSKQAAPQGNMVIFSAASADETAFPYEEKGHGMFTYYLLKKFQESKGGATLGEISSYVIDNVRQKSIVVNRKSQTPQISPSESLTDSWQKIRLKP